MTRFVLPTVTVALVIAAASASVVLRQEDTCRDVGVRCAGAPGQVFVPYDMCCPGLSCNGAGTAFGLFCIDASNPGDFTVTDVPVSGSNEEIAATTGAPTTEGDGMDASEMAGMEETEDGAEGEGGPDGEEEEGSDATVVGGATATGSDTTTTEEPTASMTTMPATETAASDDGDDTVAAGAVTEAEETSEEEAAAVSEKADATSEEDGTTISSDPNATDSDDEDDPTFGGRTTATDEDDGSVCFPAGATVELESGNVVSMDSLSIGDVIKVGVNQYSRVFMFTHKMSDATHKFVTLQTESGASLSLTDGHYLFVNGALVAAKTVNVGDVLTLGNGESSSVVAVGSASGTGLFNPQTVNGNVVVNGVLASTYTTAVEPSFAHAILAPFRMLNSFGFQFTALESGGGVLADVAPRGQAAF